MLMMSSFWLWAICFLIIFDQGMCQLHEMREGGPCRMDGECFSGYCVNQACTSDSPVPGKVGNGGLCRKNEQCYSAKCGQHGMCVLDEKNHEGKGKGGIGASCHSNMDCATDFCHNHVCASRDRPQVQQVHDGRPSVQEAQAIHQPDLQQQQASERQEALMMAAARQQALSLGLLPAGAPCQAASQCYLNSCPNGFCAAGPLLTDGTPCIVPSQCFSSTCLDGFCGRRTERSLGLPDGSPCKQSSECAGLNCINSVCRIIREIELPDGIQCSSSDQCRSRFCGENGRCMPPAIVGSKFLPDGSLCKTGNDCSSNKCFNNQCVSGGLFGQFPESPPGRPIESSPLMSQLIFQAHGSPSSRPGMLREEDKCTQNMECFSGSCYRGECSKDSAIPGKRGGTAPCEQNEQCFSGYCWEGQCAIEGPVQNTVATGAPCLNEQQCFSKKCEFHICVPW